MGNHIALRRIRVGGKRYAPGDTVPLSGRDADRLMAEGAIPDGPGGLTASGAEPRDDAGKLTEEARAMLDDVVASWVVPDDLKKNGELRKDALPKVTDMLGFEVTVEEIGVVEFGPAGSS